MTARSPSSAKSTAADRPGRTESARETPRMEPPDGEFYRQVLDQMDEGVYFVDRDRQITFWNQGAEKLTGFQKSQVLGAHCCSDMLKHINFSNADICQQGCPMNQVMETGKPLSREVYLRHRDGHRLPVRTHATAMRDAGGKIVGAVQTFSDNRSSIAARIKIAELKKTAMLDPLTGLGNRRYGTGGLRSRLTELERYGWPFGVLFIDVDNFKQVNDRFGHDAGDEALKMVAQNLLTNTRDTDLISRWGGEEFLVVTAGVDDNQLYYIAEKLRYLIEHSGFTRDGQEIKVTVSVGATLAHEGESAEELLKRVDGLMYHSKNSGRNRVTTRLLR